MKEKVYVVFCITDEEYCGREIEFITKDKNKAIEFCKLHKSEKFEHWSGHFYNYYSYEEYEIEEE